MAILTGELTGIFDNEKNAVITLDGKGGPRITVPKSEVKAFLRMKGQRLTVNAKEREYQGKIYYDSQMSQVTSMGSSATGAVTSSSGGGLAREVLIVRQNAMSHATALAIHNAGKNQVDLDLVFELANRIADAIFSTAFSQQGDGDTSAKTSGSDIL